MIKELVEMGHSKELVEECLLASFYDKNLAIKYLVDGIPDGIMNKN